MLPHFRDNREYESHLSELRVSAGLTVAEICKKAGIRPSEYTVLNSGQRSPLNRNGLPCDQAIKLCTVLGAELSDIWPRYFCSIDHSDDYPVDQVLEAFHSGMQSETPEEIYERKELAVEMKRIIDSLSYRKKKVLLRLNRSLDSIGEELEGLTRERVRQIEVLAYKGVKQGMKNSKKQELFEFFNLN